MDDYEFMGALIAESDALPDKIRKLAEKNSADACWAIAKDERFKDFFGTPGHLQAIVDMAKQGTRFESITSDCIDECMAMIRSREVKPDVRVLGTRLGQILTHMRLESVHGRAGSTEALFGEVNKERAKDGRILVPIFVPEMEGGNELPHWVLASIDFGAKSLRIMDSAHEDRNEELVAMHNEMRATMAPLLAILVGFAVSSETGVPQQKNNVDCGVCVVEYARRIFEGEALDTKTSWPDVRRDLTVALARWWLSPT